MQTCSLVLLEPGNVCKGTCIFRIHSQVLCTLNILNTIFKTAVFIYEKVVHIGESSWQSNTLYGVWKR